MRRLTLCFLLLTFSLSFAGQVKDGEWLTTWLLCGPFPIGDESGIDTDAGHLPKFDTDFLGDEANVTPKAGQTISYQGKSYSWVAYQSPDSMIDLDAAVSRKDFVCAYAYTDIQSPQEKVWLLSLGSNDGCRVWLNGERIFDYNMPRGFQPDDDVVPVFLRKGTNRLLFKIEERGNRWGFGARFRSFDSREIEKLSPFRMTSFGNGKAALRFIHALSVSRLFKEVSLELFKRDGAKAVFWKGNWDKKAEMAIPLPMQNYDHYDMQLSAILVDGYSFQQTIPFSAGKRIEHRLFSNGRTDYIIVIDDDASQSEKWAAQELQNWLLQVSGADFPIISAKQSPVENEIIVGYNDHSKRLLEEQERPDPSDESFIYRNYGPSIVIVGGSERGTMYGVFAFLENELGCRWYTPAVSVIPKKDSWSFDYLYRSEKPGIPVRNDFYYEAFEPIWAARNRINGAMNVREQPGGVEGYWAVHTFYRFMPPSEFFEEHPEYYSLIDGKRIYERAQLCLTNPEVLRLVTERVRQTIRENPDYLIYSVSQNDWANPCQCDNCQAIAKREGSEAGPLIWFVNRVAEAIEKEFPDKYIGTLAYQYTRKPPKTLRPRHNVVIRLCSIECCFAHDFYSCPENESFVRDIDGWAAIAPHLYIWDYVVNFSHYIMPYPNFYVLQNNLRTFRDHKAIGVMEQAAYQSRGGEFAELRAWVLAKLLWNPEADFPSLIDDFMYGYYGRSGQYVKAYFDLLHGRLTPETHIHLGLAPDDKLFSDEFVRQAEGLFEKAEKVADSEAVKRRVEMARLPILYLKCKRQPVLSKFDGTYDRFCRIVEREGITHYAERGEPHKVGFHREVEGAE